MNLGVRLIKKTLCTSRNLMPLHLFTYCMPLCFKACSSSIIPSPKVCSAPLAVLSHNSEPRFTEMKNGDGEIKI